MLEEINKSFKEHQESQEGKIIKQVKKAVQDLKTKI